MPFKPLTLGNLAAENRSGQGCLLIPPSSGPALRAGSDPAAASCEPLEGHLSLRLRSLASRGRPRNSRRSSALRERGAFPRVRGELPFVRGGLACRLSAAMYVCSKVCLKGASLQAQLLMKKAWGGEFPVRLTTCRPRSAAAAWRRGAGHAARGGRAL